MKTSGESPRPHRLHFEMGDEGFVHVVAVDCPYAFQEPGRPCNLLTEAMKGEVPDWWDGSDDAYDRWSDEYGVAYPWRATEGCYVRDDLLNGSQELTSIVRGHSFTLDYVAHVSGGPDDAEIELTPFHIDGPADG